MAKAIVLHRDPPHTDEQLKVAEAVEQKIQILQSRFAPHVNRDWARKVSVDDCVLLLGRPSRPLSRSALYNWSNSEHELKKPYLERDEISVFKVDALDPAVANLQKITLQTFRRESTQS